MSNATEVGVSFVRLRPSMEGFSAEVSKGLGTSLTAPMGKAGEGAGKSFTTGLSSALDSAAGKMASMGTKLSLGLTTPLVALGVKSVKMASDLNEAMNKSDTVFGASAQTIETYASNAAKNIGLTKTAALQAAGGFGNMFQQLGLGSGPTAEMSMQLLSLAADFSSFHNVDITQILEAQSAAFRGEYDSLQRFLPLISAAAVEQEALAETHKKNTKELTAQDKAMATYQLMLEGAGAAQGDFQRTATGDANATRIAAAEAENAAAAFGQKLLPVKAKLVKVLSSLLDRFNRLSPSMQGMILKGLMIGAALGPILTGLSGFVAVASFLIGLGPLVLAIGAVVAIVAILVATHYRTVHHWAMVAWNGLKTFWGWLKTAWGVVEVVLAVAGRFFVSVGRFFVGLWNIAGRVYGWFARVFGPGFSRVWASLSKNAGPVLREIGQTITAFVGYWNKAWPVIRFIGSAIVTIIVWMVRTAISYLSRFAPVAVLALSILVAAIRLGLAVIAAVWRAVWGLLGSFLVATWNFITRIISDAIAIVANLIGFVLNILQGDWGQAWNNVLNIVRSVWDAIGAVIQFAWAIVWSLLSAGIQLVSDLFSGLWTFVGDVISAIVGFIVGIWDRVTGSLSTLWTNVTGIFTSIKDWASDRVDDVVSFFAGLPGRVGQAFSGLADKITGPFTSAFDAIRNAWNRTVGGFGISIPSPFPGVPGISMKIPKMHTGGIFDPGMGGEGLALLKKGEGVFTQGQMDAIGQSRSPAPTSSTTVVEIVAPGLDTALLEWLRRSVRVRGGNVQTALGSSR
jgi:phage-related protein